MKNPYKIIKDLTYHIGTVSVELKDGNQNKSDIDIAAFTYNDAKYIRREIQVNGEDFYFLYIYIMTYAKDEKELTQPFRRIIGVKRDANQKSLFSPGKIFFSEPSTYAKQQRSKRSNQKKCINKWNCFNLSIYFFFDL